MYEQIVRPILDKVGHSEQVHSAVRSILHWVQQDPIRLGLFRKLFASDVVKDPKLEADFFGTKLRNPLVLAAGWTKNGEALEALYSLGFGTIDLGAVLEHGRKGNIGERQWAFQDKAINWIGLSSRGLDTVQETIENQNLDGIPLLINIANNEDVDPKRAPEAFGVVAERLKTHAKAFEICICPNRDGTLKYLDYDVLHNVSSAVKTSADGLPVFLKLLPGLSDNTRYDFVRAGEEAGIDGFTASNTSTNPELKAKFDFSRGKPGGFSGNDLDYKTMILDDIAFVRREAGVNRKIMASGGIQTGQDAYNAFFVGADYIQVNTLLRARGFFGPQLLLKELLGIMEKGDISHFTQIKERGANPSPLLP